MIVSARGLDDLGGTARRGLRPGRRRRPRDPGRAVEAATGLRRRLPSSRHFTSAMQARTHSRMDLRPDDHRRPRRSASLSVDNFEPDFYNEALAELATAFAAQAAMAIEKARLLETERAAREQAETLRAAAESLGSTLGVAEVFDLILTELRKVVPYRTASIQQLEANEMVIRRRPRLSEPGGAARTTLRLAGARRSGARDGRDGASRSSSRTCRRGSSTSGRRRTAGVGSRDGWVSRCSSAIA